MNLFEKEEFIYISKVKIKNLSIISILKFDIFNFIIYNKVFFFIFYI